MIGTGPYRMTELTPPLSLKATAFADYWGAPPHVADVAYTAVGRAETRALMAESGDADSSSTSIPATVTRLSQSDAVKVHSVAIPRSLLLKVNAAHPFLNSAEARQALSLAIDRAGLAQAVLRYPEGAGQLFPPSIGAWHNPALAPLVHDPAAAQALLAGLGWAPGPDGILTRDGQRFALTLTTYPDRPELPLVAAVLEQQFRAIGIEVTINSTNSSEIPAGHEAGTLELGASRAQLRADPRPDRHGPVGLRAGRRLGRDGMGERRDRRARAGAGPRRGRRCRTRPHHGDPSGGPAGHPDRLVSADAGRARRRRGRRHRPVGAQLRPCGAAVRRMNMLIARLAQAGVVALLVGAATFAMMRSLPGDAAWRIAAGRYGYDNVTAAAAEAVRAELGLGGPWFPPSCSGWAISYGWTSACRSFRASR
jgi:hypothetical protein